MLKAIWTFITNGVGNRRLIVAMGLAGLSIMPSFAQKITKVGEFTSSEDDVQFLPGAFVIVHNDIKDSTTKLYQYRSGKFVRTKANLPSTLTSWSSFAWQNIDSLNQLDLNFFEQSSISALLPPHHKIKAYTTIPGIQPGKTIEALCYTVISDSVPEDDRATVAGPRDLHLLVMARKPGPTFTYTKYTKLADLLVADEVSFGTMLLERQAGRIFIAVYFADGGSHQTNSVAIFQMRPTRAKLAAAK